MVFYSAAKVIVENNDGEILMVKESKDFIEGSWDFPGGGFEEKESIIECAEREALEETGCEVEIEKLVGVYKGSSNRTGTETIVFVFKAKLIEEREDVDLEEDIIEKKFFSPEEIPELDLRVENRTYILEKYLEGETYPLEILWDELNLLES